eukprot:753644-Hanusia_phi.AAC.2
METLNSITANQSLQRCLFLRPPQRCLRAMPPLLHTNCRPVAAQEIRNRAAPCLPTSNLDQTLRRVRLKENCRSACQLPVKELRMAGRLSKAAGHHAAIVSDESRLLLTLTSVGQAAADSIVSFLMRGFRGFRDNSQQIAYKPFRETNIGRVATDERSQIAEQLFCLVLSTSTYRIGCYSTLENDEKIRKQAKQFANIETRNVATRLTCLPIASTQDSYDIEAQRYVPPFKIARASYFF